MFQNSKIEQFGLVPMGSDGSLLFAKSLIGLIPEHMVIMPNNNNLLNIFLLLSVTLKTLYNSKKHKKICQKNSFNKTVIVIVHFDEGSHIGTSVDYL